MWWMLAAMANPGVFAGSWELTSLQDSRAEVEAAVERAAMQFNFAFRPFARTKLRKVCALDETVTVSGEPGMVQLVYTGDNARVGAGPSDGTRIDLRGSSVGYTVAGNRLTVDGRNESGSKTSVFKLTGDRLSVTHTVHSSMLGDPLVWTLTYHRREGP